jgi:hypothetical protein
MRQANAILQRNKDKRKTKGNYPGFEFKPRQVNDSSQSNEGTDHLVSHLASDEITTRGYRVLIFAKCITIMIVVLAVTIGLGSSFD